MISNIFLYADVYILNKIKPTNYTICLSLLFLLYGVMQILCTENILLIKSGYDSDLELYPTRVNFDVSLIPELITKKYI